MSNRLVYIHTSWTCYNVVLIALSAVLQLKMFNFFLPLQSAFADRADRWAPRQTELTAWSVGCGRDHDVLTLPEAYMLCFNHYIGREDRHTVKAWNKLDNELWGQTHTQPQDLSILYNVVQHQYASSFTDRLATTHCRRTPRTTRSAADSVTGRATSPAEALAQPEVAGLRPLRWTPIKVKHSVYEVSE